MNSDISHSMTIDITISIIYGSKAVTNAVTIIKINNKHDKANTNFDVYKFFQKIYFDISWQF